MGNKIQEIQKKEFERRLHILKGFTNLDQATTIELKQLEKAIGAENIFDSKGLKKLTEDVLETGDETKIFKAKQFINNLQALSVIGENGLPETVFIQKGVMDNGGGQKPKNAKNNLVQKKITDKRGVQTTKWVRADKDEPKDKNKQPKIDDEQPEEKKDTDKSQSGQKSPEDWVKETSDEDLEKYIDSHPEDDELASLAAKELASRDNKKMSRDSKDTQNSDMEFFSVNYEDGKTQFDYGDDKIEVIHNEFEDASDAQDFYENPEEYGMEDFDVENPLDLIGLTLHSLQQGVDEKLIINGTAWYPVDIEDTSGATADLSIELKDENGNVKTLGEILNSSYETNGNDIKQNSDSVNYAPEQEVLEDFMKQFTSLDIKDQEKIINASVEHGIGIDAAMKMFMDNKQDHSETHAKIDAAQQALDDLKQHTGHPDASGDNEDGVALFHDYEEAVRIADFVDGVVRKDGDLYYVLSSNGTEVMESDLQDEDSVKDDIKGDDSTE